MPLHIDDDAHAHETTDAPDWRESYYMNFLDTESDLCGFAWQGVRPNVGKGEAVFILCDEGGEPIVRSVVLELPVPSDIGGEARKIAGKQRFECVEPWRHWRAYYADDRAEIRVDWQQVSAICDWEWEDMTNSKHFQATGTVQVDAVVDGRRISFTGFGERDRAWGERNYGPLSFCWFQTMQFPDGSAAHVMTMQPADGGPMRLIGYLHQDGVTHALAEFRASDVTYASQWGPPTGARLRFVDTAGREIVATQMQPLHAVQFSVEGPQVVDRIPDGTENSAQHLTFQRFVRDDGAIGRGMVDLTAHTGFRRSDFAAREPSFTKIYDYGLGPTPAP